LSIIYNKSKFNLEAAQLLIENDLYAPSVHCSYFACLQFIKYKLKNIRGITYDDIDENTKGLDSHQYLIREILKDFNVKAKEKRDITTLQENIKDLKLFRKRSDYEDYEIKFPVSNECLTKTKQIIESLNKLK
jgi:hypothetical protein